MKKFIGLLATLAVLLSATPANAQKIQAYGGTGHGGSGRYNLTGEAAFSGNDLVIGVHNTVVTLTAAQLIAMGTTPVALLPAPGAGKTIVVKRVMVRMTRTATAFTSGGAISFQYHTGPIAVTNTVPAAVVTGAAGTVDVVRGGIDAAPTAQNDSIEITNATAPFATGTGTAKVFIWYSVE